MQLFLCLLVAGLSVYSRVAFCIVQAFGASCAEYNHRRHFPGVSLALFRDPANVSSCSLLRNAFTYMAVRTLSEIYVLAALERSRGPMCTCKWTTKLCAALVANALSLLEAPLTLRLILPNTFVKIKKRFSLAKTHVARSKELQTAFALQRIWYPGCI